MGLILSGKDLTLKRIKKECDKNWRYVIIRGGSQSYEAALRIDDDGDIVKDSGEGGFELQLAGIDSIEFTDRRSPA